MKKFTIKDIRLSPANRSIEPKQVERLAESIKKYGYIEGLPILVNEDGLIVDGQHRFLACKKLKVEPTIYEVKSFKLAPVLNQLQLKWGIRDYVKYYAEQDVEDYLILQRICKNKKLNPTTVASIIMGKSANKQSVKRGQMSPLKTGDFKIEDKSDKGLAKLERKIDAILHLVNLLNLPKTERLVIAITRMAEDKNFVFGVMEKKIEYQRSRVYRCSTIQEYINMLTTIYNNKNPKKVMI